MWSNSSQSSRSSGCASVTNLRPSKENADNSSCFTGGPRPPPLRKIPSGPGNDPCLPCGGTGDPLAPVYGRYGSYFDPDTLKSSQVVRHHRHQKLVHEILIKNKTKTKKQEMYHRLFPLAPKPYLGPHNMMWDPHVRRGPTLVHFHDLEKICPIPVKKNRKSNNMSKKHPLFRSTGCPIYPDVVVGHKLDLSDFSQFLEEQDGPVVTSKDSETQTEDLLGPIPGFRHNFDIGLHVETQADYFHIATEMRPTVANPIKQTIRSMSSVMKTQILSQCVLENMESSELAQIRGQADALELWIVQEQMRLAKAERDLCKKIERMNREAEIEAEWEKRFEDLRKRVGAMMTAACIMKSVVASAFNSMEKVGAIGANKEAEGITSWIHKAVTEIVMNNRRVAWNVLDDIIHEANRKEPQSYPQSGQGGNHPNSDMSEEVGLSTFSPGDFGDETFIGEQDGDIMENDFFNEDEEGTDVEEMTMPAPPAASQVDVKEKKPVIKLLRPKF